MFLPYMEYPEASVLCSNVMKTWLEAMNAQVSLMPKPLVVGQKISCTCCAIGTVDSIPAGRSLHELVTSSARCCCSRIRSAQWLSKHEGLCHLLLRQRPELDRAQTRRRELGFLPLLATIHCDFAKSICVKQRQISSGEHHCGYAQTYARRCCGPACGSG